MPSRGNTGGAHDTLVIKALTCMMFFTFAMTTDAVGSVIPTLLEEFELSLKAASAFHYVPMAAIAAGALGLGYLADRIGRKATILFGLAIYAASSATDSKCSSCCSVRRASASASSRSGRSR